MDTAYPRAIKSTIGRTYDGRAHAPEPQPRKAAERRRHCFGVLAGILSWTRDPLGVGAGLESWTLDEDEIRADLEHGRD